MTILYTPLSEYDVFPQNEAENSIVYETINNTQVKCYDHGNGKKQIIQLMSTDPKDYMDPSLQPGQWLHY
ncbi:YlzJ-like family protein [Halobacillus sp. Marseille-P3879]|uniref:YlzJ-like family protein n=1 Tax=Halobacillus TaxID=45667 RepID=UPI000C7CBDF1|nr:YlzJ-like family protein [Halobacillus sp. Marseille-P3879]